MLVSTRIPAFAHDPVAFFNFFQAPLFFVCFYIASKPVREHQMTVGEGFLLIVIIPFLIWVLLILGLIAVVFAFR